MSKVFKVLVALVAMTALAAPAFAITADFTGFYQVRAFSYDNLNGDDDVDDNTTGVDQRFRLWNSTALNENVKAVFALEIDTLWGGSGSGNVGADDRDSLEVKNMYLDFNIPAATTNVKAGVHYMKFGGGFIQADDAAGLQVRYTPTKETSILFGMTKAVEGAVTNDSDDTNYYHLQYDGTFGGWKISPFIAYLDGAPTGLSLTGLSEDFTAYYGGIEAAGKVGPVALKATAIYNSWDNDENVTGLTNVDDGTGMALSINAAYTMGAAKLMAEAAYYGDDELGTFVNVRGYNNFSEMVAGGRFDTRTGMGGNTSVVPANASYYMNYVYFKAGGDYKLNDTQSISAFYVFSKEAEDYYGRDAITFGHEIDAYYDHAIVPGLTFTVGGGYLLADDDFGAGDDAYKVGTALTYKF
ncbi:MAG: hypothetical protein WDA20_09005 [Desulfuromonadales bacterium]